MIDLFQILARGGGGGSGGGGGGGAGIIVIPIIIIGAIISWFKRRAKIKKAEADHAAAVAKDPTWNNEIIGRRVQEVFDAFQHDWANLDYQKMGEYLTPRYLAHITLMLQAMKQLNRLNDSSGIKLEKFVLFGVHDHGDDELDSFDVNVHGRGPDPLVDGATGKKHAGDPAFEEIWHFEREGKQWKLDGISQINNSGLVVSFESTVDQKYLDFAAANNFFYNADFGWLLMPLQGLLFSDASFGNSDINHHIIGRYHDVIVQFYQYIPMIEKKVKLRDQLKYFYRKRRNRFAAYTVAQATLPKDYKNIQLERTPFLNYFMFTPAGMTKLSLESQDFNKLFNVYASDVDRVASLELLHPAFMAKLIDLPFKVGLEIVGNNLYLYSTDKAADYQTMLNLLKEAFEEMKL